MQEFLDRSEDAIDEEDTLHNHQRASNKVVVEVAGWVLDAHRVPSQVPGYVTAQFEWEDHTFCKTVLPDFASLRRVRPTVGEEEESAEFDNKRQIQSRQRWDCRGWQERGDLPAKTTAVGTDFILSFCAKDREENQKILHHLMYTGPASGPWGNTRRPISFCTHRSLGMGAHYVDDEYQGRTNADYNFLEPPGEGVRKGVRERPWFKEYAKAAKQTTYGMLIINPTRNYLMSNACGREFGGTAKKAGLIPKRCYFMYVKEQDRIVAYKNWHSALPIAIGESYLILASQRGDVNAMRAQLTANRNVMEAVDNMGITALMHAAWYGELNAAKYLLDQRADLNVKSARGQTAFQFAIREQHYEVAKLLLDHGAQPHRPPKSSLSALTRVVHGDRVALEMQQFESASSDNGSDYEPPRRKRKTKRAKKHLP